LQERTNEKDLVKMKRRYRGEISSKIMEKAYKEKKADIVYAFCCRDSLNPG